MTKILYVESPPPRDLCEFTQDNALRTQNFYILEDNPISGLNSFSKDYIEIYSSYSGIEEPAYRSVEVTVFTLDEVAHKFCNGVFPDLLDIDIEGLDSEVLMSCEFGKYGEDSPKLICAEGLNEKAVRYIISQNYIRYFVTPHNHIFIRQDCISKVILGLE